MALEFRPARLEDREAVLAISAQIWEGHDYLPEVWESWLHSPAGPLLVAVLDGRPVALSRIELQGPAEAWLAGMRVAPAHCGKGIATALLAYTLEWLKAHHVPVSRFTTASTNTPIHHMAARFGFRLVAEVTHVRRVLERGDPKQQPRTVQADEEEAAWATFSASPFIQATAGLYGAGWTWQRFTRERLRGHLQRGEVVAWGPGPAAMGIVAYRSPETPRVVAILTGGREAGLAIVRSLACMPYADVDPDQPAYIRLTVPHGMEDLAWIGRQVGMAPHQQFTMLVYQRDTQER